MLLFSGNGGERRYYLAVIGLKTLWFNDDNWRSNFTKGKKRKIQWWRRRWIEGECFACEENLMERNEKEKKKECCRKEEEEREGKLEKKIRERDI